jgi:hypothetical protein
MDSQMFAPFSRDWYAHEQNLGQATKAGEMFGPAAFGGAAMVGGIASQLGRPSLPPEIEARIRAQEAANKRMSELDPNKFKGMDAGVKSRHYRRILGEEAFRHGLSDLGAQLLTQVESEQAAFDKQQAELERAGAETLKDKALTEHYDFQNKRNKLEAVRGKLATIYPLGTSNPNTGKTGFIDDSGNARVGNQIVPLGQYTLDRPDRPSSSGSGGVGKARDYFTPTEQRGLRGLQRDVMAQMRAAERIHGIMADAFKESGSIDILGKAGGASAFVTKVVDEVSAMGRALAKAGGTYSRSVVVEDQNGEAMYRLDGSQASAEQAAKYMSDAEFNLPPSVRKDETATRRYKAAMINLAYAIARAEEPGNPRLSDDDFKRNLAQIAEATTSPETLRQVILDRINTSKADFDIAYNQIHPQFRDEIFTKDANAMYQQQLGAFDKLYSQPFGTAGNPDVGITGEIEDGYNLGDGFTLTINK